MAQTAGDQIEGKEVALVGEDHLLRLRTVAQPKPVVEAADGLARRRAGRHGAEAGEGRARRPRRQEQVRRRLAADADVGAPPAVRLAVDVEARPPAADQFQLAQQGGELAVGRLPRHDAGVWTMRPALGSRLFGRK